MKGADTTSLLSPGEKFYSTCPIFQKPFQKIVSCTCHDLDSSNKTLILMQKWTVLTVFGGDLGRGILTEGEGSQYS